MSDPAQIPALEEFRKQWGPQWYQLISSPIWKAARATLVQIGPNTRMLNLPLDDVKAKGDLYVAQNQGWHDLINAIEMLLPVNTKEQPQEPEADYIGDETVTKTRTARRRKK